MEITRLFDIMYFVDRKFNKEVSFSSKINGEWVSWSSKDYVEQANAFSYGLMALGVKPGDKIATISNNRPEWNIVDMAVMQMGAVHVPVYPNINEDEYDFILNHSEAKYVFISSDTIYAKIRDIAKNCPTLKDIYTFEKLNTVDKLWTEVVELGRKNPQPGKLEEYKKSVKTGDVATIIYTSGTTGTPKGVMLSHSNILSNVLTAAPLFPIFETDKILSYLPVCHIYERMTNYIFQYSGASTYYVENMGTIVDNMQEIKPNAFTTVPRLLEKVYDRILYKGRNLTGIKRKIFFWSLELGHNYKESGNNAWYLIQLKIADALVFKKWREAFGGNIRFIVSGGAALQERLSRIFWAAKVPVLEGYGLTETSPVIAVNTFEPDGKKFGTVGPVLPDVEAIIADDGEILVKGPNIMKGYFKSEETTKEVIDENGWFHTGDIGEFVDNKFLKITGRKKSMFKTSMGKYVVPEVMENQIRESRFIEQIMVLGENEKFVTALIAPNFQYLKNWCNIKGHGYGNNINAVKNPEVIKRFQDEITAYNKDFSPHERIIKFTIVPDEWTIETGELTPTLKVKRRFIAGKYGKLIQKMYK